jgi:tetratricopeptide (TPR) repeat protein
VTLRLRPLALACALALAIPLALLAPERDAQGVPCAASVEEARRHMDHGLELYDKSQFREAAAEFDAAYQAQPFSASLCNAAMAYERALDFQSAIARYRSFLSAEPNPPDLLRIKTVLAWLEAQLAAQLRAHPPELDGGVPDAAAPAPTTDAGAPTVLFEVTDGGAPTATVTAPPPPVEIRSQVVVESDPPGAPLTVYVRKSGASPFVTGTLNAGWRKVVENEKTPYDVSLAAGEYHIVLDAFRDLKRSETDLELKPGRVYNFKANLSQGAFLGFLRVTSPVEGARIHVDDPPPFAKGSWGRAPHGDLIEPGPHRVWIEASGYETLLRAVTVERGDTMEVAAPLERVSYGFLLVDANAEEVSVTVDSVPYGAYSALGDPLKIRLPAGPHKVELDASGRKPVAVDVVVPRGQEVAVHGRLAFKPPRSNAVLSGTLAVGAGVGAVVLFRQPSYQLEKGLDFPGLPRVAATGTQPWFRIGGFVSLGVSGLLVAATGYALLHDPNPASNAQIDRPRELDAAPSAHAPLAPERQKTGLRLDGVTPEVCAQGGGLEIRGSF